MPIIAYGINHKSAPIEIRERMIYDPTQASAALQKLSSEHSVNEAVLISTCNRTEIYTLPEHQHTIYHWLTENHPSNFDISTFCYQYQGLAAIRHLLRVSSGLDSMVLGEPQIFGQVKQAFQIACESGTVGQQLKHLFPAIFSASKQIRHKTAIGKSPVSMAYAILQLARRIFSRVERCHILFIGTGHMIELAATYLASAGVQKFTVASRTREKAQSLAATLSAQGIALSDIPQALKEADIVISATASQLPIIGKGMVENVLRSRKHRPLLMVDLAVPRDIEAEIAGLGDVYLYNLDDLQHIIAENLKNRAEAAKQAEAMVEIQAQHYMRQLRILDAKEMILNYRQGLEKIRDQELLKALQQLQLGHEASDIIKIFAHNLVNKIMHGPTLKLRQAAYNEQMDLLLLAKNLLEIS